MWLGLRDTDAADVNNDSAVSANAAATTATSSVQPSATAVVSGATSEGLSAAKAAIDADVEAALAAGGLSSITGLSRYAGEQ